MNINKLLTGAVLIAMSSVFYSCIPLRQFEELQAKQKKCEEERNALATSKRSLETEGTELKAKIVDIERRVDGLLKDTLTLGTSLRTMTAQYDKINKLNDELLKKQALLQKGSEAENAKLMGELQKLQVELQEKEDRLKNLERDLELKKINIDKMSAELEQREKRLKELESIISQKDSAQNALKDRISKALLGYKDKGLTIYQKDGKIYVSLEAELLFAKGSTVVDSKGKEALVALAKVLETQKDISILVEGHTDTDKLAGSAVMKDNWDLSVLRATAVVRIITENKNIDSKRITAAGRGEYVPVDAGETETSKSKNRRIEVILTPNLDELFQVLDNK